MIKPILPIKDNFQTDTASNALGYSGAGFHKTIQSIELDVFDPKAGLSVTLPIFVPPFAVEAWGSGDAPIVLMTGRKARANKRGALQADELNLLGDVYFQGYAGSIMRAAHAEGFSTPRIGYIPVGVDYTAYAPYASGIVISGGSDVDPRLYNRKPNPRFARSHEPERDLSEVQLIKHVLSPKNTSKPVVLGICRGLQVALVAEGVALVQHRPNQELLHRDPQKSDGRHNMHIKPNSWLEELYEQRVVSVNSLHHQSAPKDSPLGSFDVLAVDNEGYPEVVWRNGDTQTSEIIGVQHHPEMDTGVNPILRHYVKKIH